MIINFYDAVRKVRGNEREHENYNPNEERKYKKYDKERILLHPVVAFSCLETSRGVGWVLS